MLLLRVFFCRADHTHLSVGPEAAIALNCFKCAYFDFGGSLMVAIVYNVAKDLSSLQSGGITSSKCAARLSVWSSVAQLTDKLGKHLTYWL